MRMTDEEKAASRRALFEHIKKTGAPSAWNFMPMMSPAFAAGILAVALGAGVTSAAENALPGDALFGVKLAKEAAYVALAPNAEEKITREAALARKRLDEISQLAAEDRLTEEAAEAAKDSLIAHITNAQMRISLLADAGDSPRAAELHSRIESTLSAYGKILDWKGVKEFAATVVQEADAATAVRAKTEREAAEQQNAEKGKSVREKLERSLEKTEKAIRDAKPKAEHAAPATPATVEAGKILKNAERNAAESRLKIGTDSYGEAFLLQQESERKAEEAVILIEAAAAKKIKLSL